MGIDTMVSVLDKNWKYPEVTRSEADPYPRVISFKPPTWQKTFSSVRVNAERGVVLWDLHDTIKVPTEDVYSGLAPPGCTVPSVQVEARNMGPTRAPVRKDEPTSALENRNRIYRRGLVSWIESRGWSSGRRRPSRSCRLT